jgi:hypothetical protein
LGRWLNSTKHFLADRWLSGGRAERSISFVADLRERSNFLAFPVFGHWMRWRAP